MKQLIPVYLLLISGTIAFGQTQSKFDFDTTTYNKHFNSRKYYYKTDSSFVDLLNLWNYKLDTTFKGRKFDSLKPLGELIFWRIRPVDDKISKSLNSQRWTPHFTFEIYNLADSAFCCKKSNQVRLFSSCVPPNVGGDMIIIDKFIFINSSVCVSCARYETKVDYCRPFIHYIFSKIDKTKITNLESLIQQLVIKEGKLEPNQNSKAIYHD
jgi:hypothetical protein